jgi:hypothetical protein
MLAPPRPRAAAASTSPSRQAQPEAGELLGAGDGLPVKCEEQFVVGHIGGVDQSDKWA